MPRRRLAELELGRAECRTLAEWLAVDMARLLDVVAEERREVSALGGVADRLRRDPAMGVTRRLRFIGEAVHVIVGEALSGRAFEWLASHPSDIVRQWACYAVGAASDLPIARRLVAVRPFAADRNMTVRECAWMTTRPHLALDLRAGIAQLEPLVEETDANIRRFAVEVSRPRSVWGRHLSELKRHPAIALRLLDPVRSDPSIYVRRAVANWLNDASKSTPTWVSRICREWTRTTPTSETVWIVRRALRTIERGAI